MEKNNNILHLVEYFIFVNKYIPYILYDLKEIKKKELYFICIKVKENIILLFYWKNKPKGFIPKINIISINI